MQVENKLLFISHSSPEDNYLASWLASKLTLIGYEVWVDVSDLRAGSSFWNEIELTMRNKSIRFIALVSGHYIEKSRSKDSGVYAEIMLSKILAKQIENYIIPLKVDDSNYDDFPMNVLPLNTIDFSINWGKGLKELISELVEQKVPQGSPSNNILAKWFEYQKLQAKVVQKLEEYGSNWFRFLMPGNLFVYKQSYDKKELYNLIKSPFVLTADYVIGFFKEPEVDFLFSFCQELPTARFIHESNIILDNGDQLHDIPNKLVELLNKTITNYFHHLENFAVYKAANKKNVFFPRLNALKKGFVSLRAFGKTGRKIYSKSENITWRFGLSFMFQLEPFPHLITSYHIISSDESGLLPPEDQLKYRRSVPTEWFNRDWYERVLAFLFLASNYSKKLELSIPIGDEALTVLIIPEKFEANMSYDEKQ